MDERPLIVVGKDFYLYFNNSEKFKIKNVTPYSTPTPTPTPTPNPTHTHTPMPTNILNI